MEKMRASYLIKHYKGRCERIRKIAELSRAEVLYAINKLNEPDIATKEELDWRNHAWDHLANYVSIFMSENGFCNQVRYAVESDENLRKAINCRECDVVKNFYSLSRKYLRSLKIADIPIPEIPDTEPLLILLNLPDHLRKTCINLMRCKKATASDIAESTERARALESTYLNQLVDRGCARKKRIGREVYYRTTFGKLDEELLKHIKCQK